MKNKLTITALALLTTCLVPPAAFGQSGPDASSPAVTPAASEAPAAHHGKRHHRHHARKTANADGVRCQIRHHGHWKRVACDQVVANTGHGKAMSGGTSEPLPPPPPPPPPPAPVEAAPAPVVLEIPAGLLAPYSSTEISIGGQWIGGHNTGQAGRYNGFTTSGFDFLFGFSMEKRAGWNTGDTHYFNFAGSNLDFQTGSHLARGFRDNSYTSDTFNKLGPNAELNLSFGEQGKWGVTANYNAISYTGNVISSLWTVNNGMGFLNNNMLPFGGASNNPLTAGSVTSWNVTTLTPNFEQVQTGTRRDSIQLGGKLELDQWTFATNIQHEHKQGSLEESMRATYGGMAFTLPVDYDTERFDLSASYISTDYQAQIQYVYSRFIDNNLGVTLPSPVSLASLSASSGPYAQAAFYSTPPSNSAHYLTVMLADKLSPKTRIVFNGRVGLELQDSAIPPNSADPNLSSTLGNPTYTWFQNLNSANQGTTVNSPDAKAWIYNGNLSLSTELATNLDARATYSIDGRDASINLYEVWGDGHSQDGTASIASFVVPQSWFKQNASLELGYLVLPEHNTKVTLNYTFNNTNRTNAQVEHSDSNTVSLNVTSMLGKDILGRITYEHGDRGGTMHYGTAWGNLETGAPEDEGTPSGAYYQAPMSSDGLTVRLDYAPVGDFSGGVFFKAMDNHYRYPAVDSAATPTNSGDWNLVGRGQGITRDYNFTVGPDISYRPSDNLNLHVYYTYEQIFFDNRGNGACAEKSTANCLGSVGYFQNKYTSSMHTAGFSGDWRLTDQLKLSGEYNLSYGSVLFGQYNGVAVSTPTQIYQNVVSYPDINSSMHDFKLTASYAFSESVEASLIYRYSMFNNNDWQYVPVPAIATTNTGTAISILNAGYGPPNYNVSAVGFVMRVKL